MKNILVIVCCCLFYSCSNSFINHELKFEKAGECTAARTPIKMISNINGERYEFTACMDDDFNGKNYTVERKGDSIIVGFPQTAAKKQSLFNLTLDIDAKPPYHHIMLEGREVLVVPSER